MTQRFTFIDGLKAAHAGRKARAPCRSHPVRLKAFAPKPVEQLRGLDGTGCRAVAADLTEFEKLEGWVTCLSIRLRG